MLEKKEGTTESSQEQLAIKPPPYNPQVGPYTQMWETLNKGVEGEPESQEGY